MNDFWNRPCAVPSLTSYRYKGRYGWIMIGAKDHADAMSEAARSCSTSYVDPDALEVWNGVEYVKAYGSENI